MQCGEEVTGETGDFLVGSGLGQGGEGRQISEEEGVRLSHSAKTRAPILPAVGGSPGVPVHVPGSRQAPARTARRRTHRP